MASTIGGEGEKESLNQKKILLWEGSLVAIYKDESKIRIDIYPESPLMQYSDDEIRAILKRKDRYALLQKGSTKQVGYVEIRTIQFLERKGKNGKKLRSLDIGAEFTFSSDKDAKLLSTDLYIADFGLAEFYKEPDSYTSLQPQGPPKEIKHVKDYKTMVLVENGEMVFGQGDDPNVASFNPYFYSGEYSRLKNIPSFYIDKYEVTNREYARFLQETQTPPPPHWRNGRIPEGKENHPVTGLTYREVEKYANWSGKRIPTEWEWEKAARGTGIHLKVRNEDEKFIVELDPISYPFGNRFDPLLCNTRESGLGDTLSVYELPERSASPYGVMGMCGNAPEWTQSFYLPYFGFHSDLSDFGKQFKVIRGGSFDRTAEESTSYYRSYGGIPNLARDRKAGFRLVVDLD